MKEMKNLSELKIAQFSSRKMLLDEVGRLLAERVATQQGRGRPYMRKKVVEGAVTFERLVRQPGVAAEVLQSESGREALEWCAL